MKRFAFLVVAVFCFPVLGLTGCGGSGDNSVVPVPTVSDEMSEADQAEFDAGMEEGMAEGMPEGGEGE